MQPTYRPIRYLFIFIANPLILAILIQTGLYFKRNKGGAMRIATIRITDLLLRTVIGGNDWERTTKQDVVINISLDYDAQGAIASDSMADTVDYKKLKRRIIAEVEASRFQLLEKLTAHVLGIVMEDSRVVSALVRIEKPFALRFAKTVSVEMSDRREP